MAQRFSFHHIGKANTRIAELETQLASVTKEKDDAVAALESNASEVSDSAEKLQTDLAAANTSISGLKAELATAQAAVAASVTTIADLNAKLKAKDGEVKITVARELQSAQAALGQPAAPAIPESASDPKKPLFGLARVTAAFEAETAARNAKQ